MTTDIGGSLSGAAKGTFDGKDGDQIVAYRQKLSNTFSDLLDAFLDKANIFGRIPFVDAPFRLAIVLTKRAFEVKSPIPPNQASANIGRISLATSSTLSVDRRPTKRVAPFKASTKSSLEPLLSLRIRACTLPGVEMMSVGSKGMFRQRDDLTCIVIKCNKCQPLPR